MTEALLCDLDALRRWSDHEDPGVRLWALSYWAERHPRTDLIAFARHLLDPDDDVQREVALHLGRMQDPRWAPVLTRALELESGRRRLAVIEALGLLGHGSAVAHLAPLLRGASDGAVLVASVRALGQIPGTPSWNALFPLLNRMQADDAFSAVLVRSVLGLGRAQDIGQIVARWRTWPPSASAGVDRAILDWLGGDKALARRASRLFSHGPRAVLALAGGRGLCLGADERLETALAAGAKAFLREAHAVAVDTLRARRDDLSAWMGAPRGTAAEDYRTLAIGVDGLLGALAGGRSGDDAPGSLDALDGDDRALTEVKLAFGALIALATREDEVRSLARAKDPVAELWRQFGADRAAVSPGLTSRLVELRGAAVAPLAALLGSDAADAALARAAGLVRPLLVEGVGCDALIGALVDLLVSRAQSPVAQAAADALVAIGPRAVPALADALLAAHEAGDELIAAVGRIPTESAWQALSQRLEADVLVDARVAAAMADLGDPRAIDALAPIWSPGLPLLGALLDRLCRMHGVTHEDQPQWADDVADDETGEAVRAIAEAAVPAES